MARISSRPARGGPAPERAGGPVRPADQERPRHRFRKRNQRRDGRGHRGRKDRGGGANIAPARAKQVADASGLYVTPGLIDLHAHTFWGTDTGGDFTGGYSAVQPDSHSFRSGQTTLVEVGGSGWRNFPQFKTQVIDRAKTRVLAFLNIVGAA